MELDIEQVIDGAWLGPLHLRGRSQLTAQAV
jgi:hypothetical protein